MFRTLLLRPSSHMLCDVGPVTETIHLGSLDQRQLLVCSPIAIEDRERMRRDDTVGVCWSMGSERFAVQEALCGRRNGSARRRAEKTQKRRTSTQRSKSGHVNLPSTSPSPPTRSAQRTCTVCVMSELHESQVAFIPLSIAGGAGAASVADSRGFCFRLVTVIVEGAYGEGEGEGGAREG